MTKRGIGIQKKVVSKGNQTVNVIPKKEVFAHEANQFYIYQASIDLGGITVTGSVKGSFPRLSLGRSYEMVIKEDTRSNYNHTYDVVSINHNKPMSEKDERLFLATLVSKNLLKQIYNKYPEGKIIEKITNGTFDYVSIKGIGKKTYEKLKLTIEKNNKLREVLVFCQEYDLSPNPILRFVEGYVSPSVAIQKIKENPYLLTNVQGIGFLKADGTALALGFAPTSTFRIESCFYHVIQEEMSKGHSWVEENELIHRATNLLNIKESLVRTHLQQGIPFLITVNGQVAILNVYNNEVTIQQEIMRRVSGSQPLFEPQAIDSFLENYSKDNGITLDTNQQAFFHTWNQSNVSLLVGGGGMGKSWLQHLLMELITALDPAHAEEIALLAPTGKASKVMSHYTKREASTIHRKMGKDLTNPIKEKYVIVDEVSMCDVPLMKALLTNLEEDARLLLVGDDFQLASVGYGNVLHDFIHGNVVPTTRLTKVFRQKEGGLLDIATNLRVGTHFTNYTQTGVTPYGEDSILYLENSEHLLPYVKDTYESLLRIYGDEEMVVLTPTNKGAFGTTQLNQLIQAVANPKADNKREIQVKRFGEMVTYREGDLLMNTANQYGVTDTNDEEQDIFNGDMGRLLSINEDEETAIIQMDTGMYEVSWEQLTQLSHAWALTIHKSQGSQYKVVLLVTDKSSTYQLNANLLYTGVSRAMEQLYWFGQSSTIYYGQKKFANKERRSFLVQLFQETLPVK